MDAVKFIEERNRMCKSVGDKCAGCSAFNVCEDGLCCAVDIQSTMDATAQVAIVEKWSDAHPRKTRQDLILEQWPNAETCKDKVLSACPKVFDSNFVCHFDFQHKTCNDCRREFWLKEAD